MNKTDKSLPLGSLCYKIHSFIHSEYTGNLPTVCQFWEYSDEEYIQDGTWILVGDWL